MGLKYSLLQPEDDDPVSMTRRPDVNIFYTQIIKQLFLSRGFQTIYNILFYCTTQNIINCNYIILGAYVDDHLLTYIYNNILRRVQVLFPSISFISTLHPPRLPTTNPHTSTTRHPRVRLCCAPSSTTEAARTHNNNNNICTQKKTSLRIVYAAAEAAKYYTYTKHNSIYTKKVYIYIFIYGNMAHTILYTPFVQYFYTHIIALSE